MSEKESYEVEGGHDAGDEIEDEPFVGKPKDFEPHKQYEVEGGHDVGDKPNSKPDIVVPGISKESMAALGVPYEVKGGHDAYEPFEVKGGHDAYEPFEVQSGHDAGDEIEDEPFVDKDKSKDFESNKQYEVEGGHDVGDKPDSKPDIIVPGISKESMAALSLPYEVEGGHDVGDEKKGLVSRIRDAFKRNKANETATPSSTGVDLKTLGRKVETDNGITASAVANADSKSKAYTDNSVVQAKRNTLTEEQQNTINNAFARMRKSGR